MKASKSAAGTGRRRYVFSNFLNPFVRSDDRGWADGFDADIMRSTCFQPIPDTDPQGFGTLARYFDDDPNTSFAGFNVFHFGSAHTNGINGVFADGSVHTISYDIDVVVFNALGSRNRDEIIDADAINRVRCTSRVHPILQPRRRRSAKRCDVAATMTQGSRL